ncbi:hypothetical protein [Nonomuraea sp. bgisy101]|uniref:hypothetical protein n=1 Tax=Nonomuraea sp. bgisy101 TaxID=3413784 RepID=UPI003D762EB9
MRRKSGGRARIRSTCRRRDVAAQRSWIGGISYGSRRLGRANIALLRFTPDACAFKPLGSRLAEALNALVAAAIGAARVLSLHETPLWSIMTMIAGGHLLIAPRGS